MLQKNKMNKTLSIELDDLLVKFEETLRNSNYAKKNQIRPVFKLVESKNDKNIVTLEETTLESDPTDILLFLCQYKRRACAII